MPAMTDGRCDLCAQQRPLAAYTHHCPDADRPDTFHLCTPCWSKASGMSRRDLELELFFAIGS